MAGKRQRIAEQNADILTKRRQIGSLTSLRANAKAQVLADLDAVILSTSRTSRSCRMSSRRC